VTSAPSEESSNVAAKDVAESVAFEAAQGNIHNNAICSFDASKLEESFCNSFAPHITLWKSFRCKKWVKSNNGETGEGTSTPTG
jgi:hypothetical protein